MTGFWRPQSLDELQSFIDNGLAEEGHFLEFKEAPPANKGIARQLAAFSVDGGELVFGVAERQSGVFTIEPLEHAGLPEKIDQIAQSGVQQPLLVETHTLQDESDPTRGVVWVSIPASPHAPHQVDGTYYKRSGKQTLPMPDPEVDRLIRSRRTTLEGIESALRNLMADDSDGERAHIFVIAQPIGAAPEELYDAVGGMPGWGAFGVEVQNAIGLSMMFDALGPGRYTISNWHHNDLGMPQEGFRSEVAFFNDGAVRWFSETGSATDAYERHDGREHLSPASLVSACLNLVRAMRSVAHKTGHRRTWDVGVGVTRTKGLTGHLFGINSVFHDLDRLPPFPNKDYVDVRRVSGLELEKAEWEIVRSLAHGFVEACGFPFEAAAKQLGYPAGAS